MAVAGVSGPTQPAPAVPYSRISPPDFYRQLDWIREEWVCEESVMTRKLERIERLFAELPDRYFDQAVPLLRDMGRARIVAGEEWRGILLQLGRIVSEWGRSRRRA